MSRERGRGRACVELEEKGEGVEWHPEKRPGEDSGNTGPADSWDLKGPLGSVVACFSRVHPAA